jgi:hypothetical protein
MNARLALGLFVSLLALDACKKQDAAAPAAGAAPGASAGLGSAAAPVPATGSAAGAGSAAGSAAALTGPGAAKPDPWGGTPAAGSKTAKLGAATGDDFAKIDNVNDPVPASSLKAKVDLASIEQPVAPKLAIHGFANVAPSTGFSVTYNPSKNPVHEQFRQAFVENHVFENVAEGLNSTVKLPGPIEIQTVDCNTINAFYDPNSKRIIVCYELLDYFLDVFKPVAKDQTELGNAVIGATMFSFYHETGHGLIHQLDLPAVGREEDSADQIATLILIASGDEGVQMALSGAYWFQLQQKGGQASTPFWDEHAFDGQRFYNVLCLIYGSDPKKYGGFVSSGNLPEARAARCPEEYTKINHAWQTLLGPYLTNGAALNVSYKPTISTTEAPKTSSTDPWGGGNQDPEPAEAPKPSGHQITCEQVANKAAQLIGVEAEGRARSMSPAEIEELKAKLASQLPAVMQQILTECAKKDWSDEERSCVLKAGTLDEASKCD